MPNVVRKVGAVEIKDTKFLVVCKPAKDIWINLGGKIEEGETKEECLAREVQEEFGCIATIIKDLGDFTAKAAFDDAQLILSCYLVELEGAISFVDGELEEYTYIGPDYKKEGVTLADSIKYELLPYCVKQGLLKWPKQ